MVTSPRLLRPEKDYASEDQQYCRRQTRFLVRKGATEKQDSNCQKVINIWSWAPDWARNQDWLTDRPSVAMWLDLTRIIAKPIFSPERMIHKDTHNLKLSRHIRIKSYSSLHYALWVSTSKDDATLMQINKCINIQPQNVIERES
jgi:hypothetical protein